MKQAVFKMRLALADLAFKLGLFALVSVLMPWVCGGTDSTGGVVTDATNVAASEFAYAYKEFYMGGIENANRSATVLLDRLTAKGQPFQMEGSKVIMAVKTKRNGGAAFTTGRGPWPTAGSTDGIRPESTHSRLVQAVAFDLSTLQLAATDRGAFGRVMDVEMSDVEETGRLILSHALYKDKTRRLGTVASGANSTTIVFDNAGLENAVSGDITKYFFVGQYIDFVSGANATLDEGLEVVSINPTANSVTFDATVDAGVVAGSYAVPGRLGGGGNDLNRGVSGLAAALGSTTNTYWGINRSTAANALWRPVRVDAGNGGAAAALSQQLLRKLKGIVRRTGADRGGRMAPGMQEGAMWLTSIEDKDAYTNLLTNLNRTVNTFELKGNWVAIEAEGYPMVDDADAPVGRIRFLNWADWNLGSPTGNITPTLINAPDGLVFRQVSTYDLWAAYLSAELELGCFMPNRSGELYNLNTAAYAV